MALDANMHEKVPSKPKVAKKLKVHEEAVSKVSKNYVTHGLEVAIQRKKRETPPVPAKVTGEVEAHIITICRSEPPEGKSRWSMQMVANKIILNGVVDSISDETVRRVLKKRN